MNTMADKRLSQLDCLDVQDDDEITENGIDKPEDNVDDGNKAYDRSTLHAAFRQLREAQQSLEEALFETRNKLNKSSEAHSLDLNELVRYAHYISIDHSVAAPLNWEQGDPRRPYPTESEMRAGWLGRLNQLPHGCPIPPQLIHDAVPQAVKFPQTLHFPNGNASDFISAPSHSVHQEHNANNIRQPPFSVDHTGRDSVGGGGQQQNSTSAAAVFATSLAAASSSNNDDVETMSTDSSDSS